MVEYLIQGETLKTIADTIREFAGNPETKYNPIDMPKGIYNVRQAGYAEGANFVKTSEAQTVDNVILDEANIAIVVPKGYYAASGARSAKPFYDKGQTDLKTNEKKTVNDITLDNENLAAIVPKGYYATTGALSTKPVYDKGYEDGLAAGGGGGGDDPYDPTTVWLLNDVLVNTGSGIQGTTINAPFVSAGEEFVKITHTTLALNYYRSDGTSEQAWSSRKGWTSDDYKTITFPEEITDQTLINWLDTNATLIGGGGGEEEPLDDTGLSIILDQTQSPTVTIQNANLDNHYFFPVGIYGQRNDYDYTFDDYIEMEESSPSSNPFTLSAMNHTQLYAYIYVYVSDEANYEDFAQIIEVPPYGDNSLDFGSHLTQGNPCKWVWEIRGARFTRYAVEI